LAILVPESFHTLSLSLAHVPIRSNHLIDKNMRQIKSLSMILAQKWFPLLPIMLYTAAATPQAPGVPMT
jgi:hypothetical protein